MRIHIDTHKNIYQWVLVKQFVYKIYKTTLITYIMTSLWVFISRHYAIKIRVYFGRNIFYDELA